MSVSALSKIYPIYERPQDRLLQSIMPRLQRVVGADVKSYHRTFKALDQVSFEVRRGQALGIIGRNGSGKSTLLQMICGTLQPTSGSVQLHGRVAALLELGAGFNPEFTGRENIHMSASVLGMTSAEVAAVYDDIVEFSGIDPVFIEQPVKIYSSGMYVRLAFAVIAHVNADVLIIDEALAVGDAVFVQKCMRFLRAFRERGTLLFVSHDTGSVINFCDSAIWLDRGEMRMHGDAESVSNAYLEYCAQQSYGEAVKIRSIKRSSEAGNGTAKALPADHDVKFALFDNIANSDGWTSDRAEILSSVVTGKDGAVLNVAAGGERVRLTITARANGAIVSPIIGFFVKDRLGQSLFGDNTFSHMQEPLTVSEGQILEAEFVFQLPMLPDGDYSMTVAIAEGDPWVNIQHHWVHDAVMIKVASTKLRYGLVGIPFEAVTMKVV
ncbi:ABC transporter ATP-binding protein [Pseudoxanthomonas sp. CCNWLW251]